RWCNFSGHDCYIYGNSAVWEDDFVDNNNSYIDQNDIFFYEGHGWPGGFTVRAPDDEYVQHGEVQGDWGDVDLEWGFLLSCSVIADSSRGSWHGAMDRMHGIAGFRNTAYDVNGFGSKLATYIVFGYTYKDAWFKTCDTKQPSGVQAQIIVEDSKFWNESAYNQLSDVSHDGTYWYWWKSCGAEAPSSLTPAQLGDVFPIFQTPPLSASEQVTVENNLAAAFAFGLGRDGNAISTEIITGTKLITDTQGRQLEIDADTGLFYYYDPARTFTDTTESLQAQAILTPADAKDIADAFLREKGILPTDAVFNTVDDVVIGSAGGADAAAVEAVTGYQVIYNRYLTADVVNAAGVAQTVQIAVDGPGSKIKVYVDPTAANNPQVANANQVDAAVVGAMGGWRPTQAPVGRAVDTVPLLDYQTQILKLFESNDLEPLASYESVPFTGADAKTAISYTVTGWEESSGEDQNMIYPSFRISAVYTDTDGAGTVQDPVVFTGSTWIAGNPQFMRPLAKVATLPDLDKRYVLGDTIAATAADASKTLAELGYDAALNFVMGGPNALFSYEWYLGDVETGTKIGDGATLDYQLAISDFGPVKDGVAPLIITLKVTNTATDSTSLNHSISSFKINAVPSVYLPGLSSE
ncbi:MAG: hypothetical protein KDD84_01700, partial [Caldilineaceae bacterium]|nr:hypothetical protein [Caldilineaceae bacterium]